MLGAVIRKLLRKLIRFTESPLGLQRLTRLAAGSGSVHLGTFVDMVASALGKAWPWVLLETGSPWGCVANRHSVPGGRKVSFGIRQVQTPALHWVKLLNLSVLRFSHLSRVREGENS